MLGMSKIRQSRRPLATMLVLVGVIGLGWSCLYPQCKFIEHGFAIKQSHRFSSTEFGYTRTAYAYSERMPLWKLGPSNHSAREFEVNLNRQIPLWVFFGSLLVTGLALRR